MPFAMPEIGLLIEIVFSCFKAWTAGLRSERIAQGRRPVILNVLLIVGRICNVELQTFDTFGRISADSFISSSRRHIFQLNG